VFVEEAEWIRARLESLPLPAGTRVLDIGSSTLEYRTVHQPHISELVHRPLLARGCKLTCGDIKEGDGVDLVVDLSRRDLPAATFAAPYDLVICSNILEHIPDRETFITNVLRFCATPGFLLCTVPRTFPYHADPIDTMYRPTTAELAQFIFRYAQGGIEAEEVIRIDDRSYYEFRPGRIMDHLLMRSLRMRLRGYVAPLRWKVSCVLLKIAAPARAVSR
jgi:SAM-dependent methyltransferase